MNKTKPWTGGTDEEYETQHFGFGAQRLKAAVRQMVEQKITTGVKDMESYLQESLDLNEADKATLAKSCGKLVHLYCERAGPSLEIIDEEVERVLRIPSNVLLREDEAQLEQMSEENLQNLREEVANLRKRVKRGALMEALLTAEYEELCTAELEQVCEAAKSDMKELDQICKSTDNDKYIKNINEEAQFLCASTTAVQKPSEHIFDA